MPSVSSFFTRATNSGSSVSGFDQQPARFRLPKRRTVTRTGPARNIRSDITNTYFDARGNPRGRTGPDGGRTDRTCCPAGGSGPDCRDDRVLREILGLHPTVSFTERRALPREAAPRAKPWRRSVEPRSGGDRA